MGGDRYRTQNLEEPCSKTPAPYFNLLDKSLANLLVFINALWRWSLFTKGDCIRVNVSYICLLLVHKEMHLEDY